MPFTADGIFAYDNIKMPVDIHLPMLLMFCNGTEPIQQVICKEPGTWLLSFLDADLSEYREGLTAVKEEFLAAESILMKSQYASSMSFARAQADIKYVRLLASDVLQETAVNTLKDVPDYVPFLLRAELAQAGADKGILSKYVDIERYRKASREMVETALRICERVCNMQNEYNEYKRLIWLAEGRHEFTQAELFHGFQKAFPDIAYHTMPVIHQYLIIPKNSDYSENNYFKTIAEYNQRTGISPADQLKALNKGKNNQVSLQPLYIISKLRDMLFLEFMRSMQLGYNVAKCQNCGRMFLTHNPNRIFCNNLAPNGKGNQTCRDIGAKIKASSDINVIVYNKYHNRYAAYIRRKSNELMYVNEVELNRLLCEHNDWLDMAREKLSKYRSGEITGKEFLEKTKPRYGKDKS